MQVYLELATKEQIERHKGLRKAQDKAIETIRMFAPVQRPQVEPSSVFALSPEGLGAHGCYEDATHGRDFFAPVVLSDFSFVLDYPIEHEAFARVSKGPEAGYSAADLIRAVQIAYEGIYRMEDGDTPAPEKMEFGGITFHNRPATDGMFGIWGHGIGDLAIEEIAIHQIDGETVLYVSIGS